jgi:hypothetical protein
MTTTAEVRTAPTPGRRGVLAIQLFALAAVLLGSFGIVTGAWFLLGALSFTPYGAAMLNWLLD